MARIRILRLDAVAKAVFTGLEADLKEVSGTDSVLGEDSVVSIIAQF